MGLIRPLRPQDAGALRAFLERLSPESRYGRFQYVVKEVTPQMLQLLLVADPRAHVALGAFEGTELVGEARYVRDAERGEFALAVADHWRRRGLGLRLIDRLTRLARLQGLRRLDGEVLAGNAAMIAFVAHAGFTLRPHPEDGRLVQATQELNVENRGQSPISENQNRGQSPKKEKSGSDPDFYSGLRPAKAFSRSASTARYSIGAGFG